jgi:predicted amidohydrolase YtcJ
LGVIVSIQPAFLASEGAWLPKRIDPERLRWTYPFRSLLEAGVRLAGGSDCPVEPPDPLWGMTAACRRGGLTPSESLTGAQALGLFTDGVAAGGGRPLPTQVGQPANFTVLGADPTDHPAPHRIEMLATVIDGVVFRGEPEFEWPG